MLAIRQITLDYSVLHFIILRICCMITRLENSLPVWYLSLVFWFNDRLWFVMVSDAGRLVIYGNEEKKIYDKTSGMKVDKKCIL